MYILGLHLGRPNVMILDFFNFTAELPIFISKSKNFTVCLLRSILILKKKISIGYEKNKTLIYIYVYIFLFTKYLI